MRNKHTATNLKNVNTAKWLRNFENEEIWKIKQKFNKIMIFVG